MLTWGQREKAITDNLWQRIVLHSLPKTEVV